MVTSFISTVGSIKKLKYPGEWELARGRRYAGEVSYSNIRSCQQLQLYTVFIDGLL